MGSIEELRALPVFAELSDDALQRVLDRATEAEAQPGQVLIEPKREASGLFVLLEGSLAVEAGAREIICSPGDLVGELALLAPDTVRTARVQARTAARFLAITRADFEKLVEEEPAFTRALLRMLAQRLARTMTT